MSRLRLAAAALAVLTLLIDGLFWINDGVGMAVIGGTAVAAGCLLAVVPFGADDPPGRKRVLAACIAYLVVLAVSLATALADAAGLGPLAALAGLMGVGVVLAGWAFRTRNRRRRSVWNDYYDMG